MIVAARRVVVHGGAGQGSRREYPRVPIIFSFSSPILPECLSRHPLATVNWDRESALYASTLPTFSFSLFSGFRNRFSKTPIALLSIRTLFFFFIIAPYLRTLQISVICGRPFPLSSHWSPASRPSRVSLASPTPLFLSSSPCLSS